MYVKQIARATIDNPHADGIINPGGRGHMLTCRFDDPATDLLPPPSLVTPYSMTARPEGFWDPARNTTASTKQNFSIRVYPEVQAATIASLETQRPHYLTTVNHGALHDADAVENHWEPVYPGGDHFSNLWQEVAPQQRFKVSKAFNRTNFWLWFTDARGMYDATNPYTGQVNLIPGIGGENRLPNNPSFTLRLWRDAVPDTVTEDGAWSYVELILWHPGDLSSEGVLWSLGVPGPTGSYDDKPKTYLGRKGWNPPDGDTPGYWDTEWKVLAEFDASLAAQKGEEGPTNTCIMWETLEDRILLSIGGEEFNYWVPPQYRADSSGDTTLSTILESLPTLIIAGHSCAFNLSPMSLADKLGGGAGANGWIESRYAYPIDENVFNLDGTPSCTLSSVLEATGGLTVHSAGWVPGGSYITPSVTSEGAGPAPGDQLYRLRATLGSLSPYERPVAHHVTYNWNPVIAAGTSAPFVTQGYNYLLSASGQVTHDWRNATCDLVLDIDKVSADAQVQTWVGNNKVSVVAGWETDTSADVATQFTGYTTSRAMALPADRPQRSRVELPCMDGFYRLEKHFWLDLGNFERFRWDECFHRVLHSCGIPDSMISCFAGASQDNALVDMSRLGTEPKFQFQEDTTVIEGLNQLVSSWGCVWGVNQNGVYFLTTPSEYVGTYDWTLDDDSLTETDVLFDLRAESTFDAVSDGQPFVNYVFVRLNRDGEEEVAWRLDCDPADPDNYYKSLSHHVDTSAYFIGEDWHHVYIGTSEEHAEEMAARILKDRQKRKTTLNFTAPKKVQLWPDDYVRVQATGIGVANNSIFKITSKSWKASSPPEGDGSFTATYEAVFVQ